jgi:hypothetical protein
LQLPTSWQGAAAGNTTPLDEPPDILSGGAIIGILLFIAISLNVFRQFLLNNYSIRINKLLVN